MIIGITGKIASGKDTVANYLQEKLKGVRLGFSDALAETLAIYDLPVTRENLQKLSTILRQNFSEDILAKAMAKKASESGDRAVIIDGVRRNTDIDNFKSQPDFYLIFVETSLEIRYQRYIQRGRGAGDKEMSLAEFTDKDNAESEKQIGGLKDQAQYVVGNNGTLEELYHQLENIIKKIKK